MLIKNVKYFRKSFLNASLYYTLHVFTLFVSVEVLAASLKIFIFHQQFKTYSSDCLSLRPNLYLWDMIIVIFSFLFLNVRSSRSLHHPFFSLDVGIFILPKAFEKLDNIFFSNCFQKARQTFLVRTRCKSSRKNAVNNQLLLCFLHLRMPYQQLKGKNTRNPLNKST